MGDEGASASTLPPTVVIGLTLNTVKQSVQFHKDGNNPANVVEICFAKQGPTTADCEIMGITTSLKEESEDPKGLREAITRIYSKGLPDKVSLRSVQTGSTIESGNNAPEAGATQPPQGDETSSAITAASYASCTTRNHLVYLVRTRTRN